MKMTMMMMMMMMMMIGEGEKIYMDLYHVVIINCNQLNV